MGPGPAISDDSVDDGCRCWRWSSGPASPAGSGGDGSGVEGGFSVGPGRGRRYAAEAVVALLAMGADHGLTRVMAGTALDNIALQRTLTRAGFQLLCTDREASPLRGGTRDREAAGVDRGQAIERWEHHPAGKRRGAGSTRRPLNPRTEANARPPSPLRRRCRRSRTPQHGCSSRRSPETIRPRRIPVPGSGPTKLAGSACARRSELRRPPIGWP